VGIQSICEMRTYSYSSVHVATLSAFCLRCSITRPIYHIPYLVIVYIVGATCPAHHDRDLSESKPVPLRHAGAKLERRYSSCSFLISALRGWMVTVTPRPRITPGEGTTDWTGGWVDLKAGLGKETRGNVICLCRATNPVLPGCSQTLYWQSCPSFLY
jgi:hypothetical protein